MLHHPPPIAKAHHRNDTHTPRNTTEPHPRPQPSPVPWGNPCGSDDRDCLTHNLAQPLYPRRSRHHWRMLCTRDRHRDGVIIPDAGLHPQRDAMNKQHTHSAKTIALCALQRPTCPQSNATERHPAGMYPQQRKDNGDQSTIWRGHTKIGRASCRERVCR